MRVTWILSSWWLSGWEGNGGLVSGVLGQISSTSAQSTHTTHSLLKLADLISYLGRASGKQAATESPYHTDPYEMGGKIRKWCDTHMHAYAKPSLRERLTGEAWAKSGE